MTEAPISVLFRCVRSIASLHVGDSNLGFDICYARDMDWTCLYEIPIVSRCLTVDAFDEAAPLSFLRGQWEDTVCRLSREVFDEIVRGKTAATRRPGFLLCRAGSEPGDQRFSFRWSLIGEAALGHDALLCRSWETVGLRVRRRSGNRPLLPVVEMAALGPDGQLLPSGTSPRWRLSDIPWPLGGSPENAPCRLVFDGGLHVSAKKSDKAAPPGEDKTKREFVLSPHWPHLVRSSWNRIRPWLPRAVQLAGDAELPGWLAEARARPAVGKWVKTGIYRRSTPQNGILFFKASTGHLNLPEGPGPIWPLLCAAYRLGLGHHTTEGLGFFDIAPFPGVPDAQGIGTCMESD